jgi:hypothetical protein
MRGGNLRVRVHFFITKGRRMDASAAHSVSRGLAPVTDDGPSCHVCGYSRLGIPAQGLCPECGEPPSPPVSIGEATAALTLAKTQSDRAWLWCVGLGLALLVVCSVSALRVALVMRAGSAAVAAVNLPAPKVWASSLVQRSIGNRPGEWGIAGTLAVLGCLVGVWLATEPRSLRPAGESPVSVRRLARWLAVVLTGAGLGVLLGGYSIPYGWSEAASRALLVSVALVELPVNTLLYLHLRGVAKQLRDRRAEALLDVCAWLVPAVIAAAAALTVLHMQWEGEARTVRPWRLATLAYGAAAATCGVIATAAVVRLALTALSAAAGDGPVLLARRAARLPRRVRRALGVLRRADVARWLVVLGIVWWLWNLWPAAAHALTRSSRDAVGGTVPFFNFPGPKVLIQPLTYAYYPVVSQFALDTLLLVWLLTARGVCRHESVLRPAARWAAVVLIGLAIGWRLSDPLFDRGLLPLHRAAVIIVCIEAPLTLLLYLHLAVLASRVGARGLGMALGTLAFVTTAMLVTPAVVVYLYRGLPRRAFDSDAAHLVAGVYVCASLAVALLAASALARLAVVLLTTGDRRPQNSPNGD